MCSTYLCTMYPSCTSEENLYGPQIIRYSQMGRKGGLLYTTYQASPQNEFACFLPQNSSLFLMRHPHMGFSRGGIEISLNYTVYDYLLSLTLRNRRTMLQYLFTLYLMCYRSKTVRLVVWTYIRQHYRLYLVGKSHQQ